MFEEISQPTGLFQGVRSVTRRVWGSHVVRTLLRRQTPVLGAVILLAVVLGAVLAPVLPIKDPNAVKPADRLQSWFESAEHPLGTDDLGRDLLSRLIWGARSSLAAGVLSAVFSMVAGVAIGMISGFKGGKVDLVIMRLLDILMAFPLLILAMTIMAALGPGLRNAMIAIAIVGLPLYARVIRGTTLALKEGAYVEAARSIGAGDARIMVHHILPNTAAAIIVLFTLDIGTKIVLTSGLSFLGLGSQPPTADWGAMVALGRPLITTAPLVSSLPGIAIMIVVLSFNLLGDGLRDALDPRLKGS